MKRLVTGILLAFSLILATPAIVFADHWYFDPDTGVRVHWADNDPSYPRGYLVWVDNTGPEWPVYSAAVEWDKAARLDAVYASTESACPSHCVSVNETDVGTPSTCGPTLGVTTKYYYPSTGHMDQSTYIRLDQQCGTASYDKRRTIACHEMGHSIGFDEQYNTTAASCMRSPYTSPAIYPSSHDYDAIAVTYNHND